MSRAVGRQTVWRASGSGSVVQMVASRWPGYCSREASSAVGVGSVMRGSRSCSRGRSAKLWRAPVMRLS